MMPGLYKKRIATMIEKPSEYDGSILLFGAILCWFMGLLILAWASAIVWTLRDGLGPDSVESHGLLALSRFWRDMRSIFILYVIPLSLLGCLLYRWNARRRPN
jgi:hypothetical protein